MGARRRRQPLSIWRTTRERVWLRDLGRCQGPYCQTKPPWSLPLNTAHIDHILELSRGGNNADHNLRTLCRRCHVLRASIQHQGLVQKALKDEIIPANWRELVWE
jgi:5-methylcytosine-specific restriction endonuclease McrA